MQISYGIRSGTLSLVIFLAVFLCSAGAGEVEEQRSKSADATEAQAPQEEKVSGNVAMGVFSKYIFRGYELSRDSVVIQPSITASYRGFSATLWGNIDTNAKDTQNYLPSAYGKRGHKWFNETDLSLSYSYPIDKLTLTGGYIYYNTKYAEETEEFFLSAAYDIFTKPVLTVYQDVNSYPGTYINLSLSHSLPLHKERGITLDLGASASYFTGQGRYWKTFEAATGDYTGKKYRAFHDGMVKAGLTVPVTKAFTVQPQVQFWFPLSGDAKKKIGAASYNPNGYLGTNVVFGANLIYNF